MQAASDAMREVFGRGDRHGARADCGVRAGRLLSRHDRPALPAVRADDRLLGGDLRVQRDDADAGAVGAAAPSRRGRAADGSSARSSAASRAGTRVYVASVRGLVRARWAVAVVFVGLLGLTYYVYNRVPRAFVPEEDAGYFISIVQAPPGASLEYTTHVVEDAEKILLAAPEVESVFSILGFSFTGSASNQGIIFTLLKPFEERRAAGAAHPGAAAAPARPAVRHPGRARRPVCAARHQHRQRRRFHLRGAGSGRRRRYPEPWQRRAGAGRRVAAVDAGGGALQLVHRQRSAAGGRHRSREGAKPWPADRRDHERAADLSRVGVRQRLRFQQPRLPRLRAGGQGVSVGPAGSRSVLRADDERPDGAARQRGARPRDDGAAGDQPLQPVPVGADQRRRRRPG